MCEADTIGWTEQEDRETAQERRKREDTTEQRAKQGPKAQRARQGVPGVVPRLADVRTRARSAHSIAWLAGTNTPPAGDTHAQWSDAGVFGLFELIG